MTQESLPAPVTSESSGLTVRNLVVAYGGSTAIHGLSLHVPAGKTLAIVGPSGCGKSTVLRSIVGLVNTSGGEILVDGQDLSHLPASKREIGLVPQNYALFPHLSVRGNIEYGLKARGVAKAERQSVVENLLTFTEMGQYADRNPAQLSGGQRQRVALARAMAIEPRVLLLDEPLAALDPLLRETMRRQLAEMLGKTNSVNIVVTHDRHEAFALADLVAVMRDGRLVQIGSPEELWESPVDNFVADFLCGAAYLDAWATGPSVSVGNGTWTMSREEIGLDVVDGEIGRILLRPTSLKIQREASPNSVEAEVLSAEYAGGVTVLSLLMAGETVPAVTDLHVGRGEMVHALLADPSSIRICKQHLEAEQKQTAAQTTSEA